MLVRLISLIINSLPSLSCIPVPSEPKALILRPLKRCCHNGTQSSILSQESNSLALSSSKMGTSLMRLSLLLGRHVTLKTALVLFQTQTLVISDRSVQKRKINKSPWLNSICTCSTLAILDSKDVDHVKAGGKSPDKPANLQK